MFFYPSNDVNNNYYLVTDFGSQTPIIITD